MADQNGSAPAQQGGQQNSNMGKVAIIGRIVLSRKAGSYFETLVKMAAPDLYSSPATVSILSKERIGQSEEEFRGVCRLGGFARQYKSTDQESGETRKVSTADNKLFYNC